MRMATVRDRWRIAAALAAVVLAWVASGAARADSSVVDLPLGGGAVERVLYMAPANPSAVLVMFSRGDGGVLPGQGGEGGLPRQLVSRTRPRRRAPGVSPGAPLAAPPLTALPGE